MLALCAVCFGLAGADKQKARFLTIWIDASRMSHDSGYVTYKIIFVGAAVLAVAPIVDASEVVDNPFTASW